MLTMAEAWFERLGMLGASRATESPLTQLWHERRRHYSKRVLSDLGGREASAEGARATKTGPWRTLTGNGAVKHASGTASATRWPMIEKRSRRLG